MRPAAPRASRRGHRRRRARVEVVVAPADEEIEENRQRNQQRCVDHIRGGKEGRKKLREVRYCGRRALRGENEPDFQDDDERHKGIVERYHGDGDREPDRRNGPVRRNPLFYVTRRLPSSVEEVSRLGPWSIGRWASPAFSRLRIPDPTRSSTHTAKGIQKSSSKSPPTCISRTSNVAAIIRTRKIMKMTGGRYSNSRSGVARVPAEVCSPASRDCPEKVARLRQCQSVRRRLDPGVR